MTTMEILGRTVYGIVLLLMGTLFYLGAASSAWEWFVMPIFGVRAVTYAELLGLGVAIRLWTGRLDNGGARGWDAFVKHSWALIGVYGIAWGLAWLYHLAVLAGY
jgi:hypothetical protein